METATQQEEEFQLPTRRSKKRQAPEPDNLQSTSGAKADSQTNSSPNTKPMHLITTPYEQTYLASKKHRSIKQHDHYSRQGNTQYNYTLQSNCRRP